jgi:hypothetical protein
MHGLDPELDAGSLADNHRRRVWSDQTDPRMATWNRPASPGETGQSAWEYAIHLFGGDVNATLKGVRGGTQQIAQGMLRQSIPTRDAGQQGRVRRDLGRPRGCALSAR